MDAFPVVCTTCGTVNSWKQTHCLACGQVLRMEDEEYAATAAPTVSGLARDLLNRRYRVMHAIGRGGMGTVYIGRDEQLGNRLVAIKELVPGALAPADQLQASQNFQQEAHLLAGLHHPHLPEIYDYFVTEQRCYLVMRFIQGQPLTAYLQERGGYLDVDEVIQIGQTLCTILGYLHNQHPPIIFRDLKPSNIMRMMDGHIYLIDFGIARFFKHGQISDTSYQGTLGYAPPEQYGATQTTPRSDIYALGATLYHLLSGYEPSATPFRLPPLQPLAPEAPAELVALITAMLDLDAERRPQNVEAIRSRLQEIARHEVPTPVIPAKAVSAPHSEQLHSPRVKLLFLFLLALVTIPGLMLAVFLVLQKHAAASNASSQVVTTFCDAIDLAPSDIQTAYSQLSASYQRVHSLSDFQTLLEGASRCQVVNRPDADQQAEVLITMSCILPPGAPQPPPGAPPLQSVTPVYLRLSQGQDGVWKIDQVSVRVQICPPPGRAA